MIKSENIDLVMSAFVKAQSEMSNAFKSSANPFFKSKYADLNAIREAIMPALANHKLGIAQPIVVVDGKNYVQTMIVHESGQYFGGLTEIICAKVNDAQNFGAGMTYARRFGLQALGCVGADDDDGETAVGRKPTSSYTTFPKKETTTSNKIELNATQSPQNAVLAQGSETPKKGGFGVKKEAPVVEDGWN